MAPFLRLVPLLLVCACGGDDPGDPDPPDAPLVPVDTAEPADTDPPDDTDPPTEPPTEPELCPALPPAPASATVLTPGSDLQAAVDAAAPGDVLALEDGAWTLTSTLVIRTPGVTLRGRSGDPAAAVLTGGDALAVVLHVAASDVTVAGLTLTGGTSHGLRVQPEDADVTGVVLSHLEIVDNGREQMIVDADAGRARFADDGVLGCSRVALTDAGRGKVAGICETGGVHIRRARGWAVRDNVVEGLWCSVGAAGFAIRLSEGTRDGLIERNYVKDSANGIALGRGTTAGRTYDDAPCGGATAQDFDGTVRNNMVHAWRTGLMDSAAGVGVQIGAESACGATIVHNTTYSRQTPGASIEFRYPLTTGAVANNLCNSTIRRRDDAASVVSSNVEHTPDATFVHAPTGDLHLSPGATSVMGAADPAWAVDDDFDGQPRDPSSADIGADEHY